MQHNTREGVVCTQVWYVNILTCGSWWFGLADGFSFRRAFRCGKICVAVIDSFGLAYLKERDSCTDLYVYVSFFVQVQSVLGFFVRKRERKKCE